MEVATFSVCRHRASQLFIYYLQTDVLLRFRVYTNKPLLRIFKHLQKFIARKSFFRVELDIEIQLNQRDTVDREHLMILLRVFSK